MSTMAGPSELRYKGYGFDISSSYDGGVEVWEADVFDERVGRPIFDQSRGPLSTANRPALYGHPTKGAAIKAAKERVNNVLAAPYSGTRSNPTKTKSTMDNAAFVEAVRAKARLGVGHLRISTECPIVRGRRDMVTISFYNVPHEAGKVAGGAVAMNNRLLMFVDGFARDGGPPPTGKVKFEVGAAELLSGAGRKRPRGKTASPEKVADYVAKIVTEASELKPRVNPRRKNPVTLVEARSQLEKWRSGPAVILKEKASGEHFLLTESFYEDNKVRIRGQGIVLVERAGVTKKKVTKKRAKKKSTKRKNPSMREIMSKAMR